MRKLCLVAKKETHGNGVPKQKIAVSISQELDTWKNYLCIGGLNVITCNLKKVLGEKNLRITKVSKDIGISRTTLTALANHTNQGIQFDTLNKLLNYLQVGVEELITYQREELSNGGMNITFPINELTKGLIIRITGLEYLPDVAFIGRFARLENDVLSVDDVYYDGRTHGTELFSGNSLYVDIPTSEQIFEYGMVCGMEKSEGDGND